MICVKSLLKLKSFQSMKLVAGSGGVYRRVSWPNIAQTVSIREWLVGGDVILMTGVGLEHTADFINQMVRQAAEGDAACLIILLSDQLISEIPQETIAYAEELKFPIFAAPWETQIANVIRDISSLILTDQYGESAVNEMLDTLLFGSGVVSPALMESFVEKYRLAGPHKVIVAKCRNRGEEEPADINKLPFLIQIGGLLIQEMKNTFSQCLYINRNQTLTFLVRLEAAQEPGLKDVLGGLRESLQRQYPQISVSFGIGDTYTGPEHFGKSCREAVKALNLSTSDGVTVFADLGIFRLLMLVPDQQLVRDYAFGRLEPLISYDKKYQKHLLSTLETYLMTNCNYVKTAQLMYLHRNTLSYRIDKIKELLNVSLEQAETRNYLFNCLKIYQYSK